MVLRLMWVRQNTAETNKFSNWKSFFFSSTSLHSFQHIFNQSFEKGDLANREKFNLFGFGISRKDFKELFSKQISWG